MHTVTEAESWIRRLESIQAKLISAADKIAQRRQHSEPLEDVLNATVAISKIIDECEQEIIHIRAINKKHPPAA